MKHLPRTLALVVATGLLLSACGGDDGASDDGQAAPDTEAAGANDEFCNAYVEAQAAVITVAAGGDPGDVPPLLDEVEATVPEEVAGTIEEFIPQVREALETQDQSVFETEGFRAADEEVDAYVADNCGFESYDVSAVDYEFEGLPSNLPPGNVTINWTNDGEEVHEMTLVRFRNDDARLDDLLEMTDRQAEREIEFIGGFFGESGAQDTETLPLEPGRYAAVCFIPVGATDLQALETADGPPHVARGMSLEFTVE